MRYMFLPLLCAYFAAAPFTVAGERGELRIRTPAPANADGARPVSGETNVELSAASGPVRLTTTRSAQNELRIRESIPRATADAPPKNVIPERARRQPEGGLTLTDPNMSAPPPNALPASSRTTPLSDSLPESTLNLLKRTFVGPIMSPQVKEAEASSSAQPATPAPARGVRHAPRDRLSPEPDEVPSAPILVEQYPAPSFYNLPAPPLSWVPSCNAYRTFDLWGNYCEESDPYAAAPAPCEGPSVCRPGARSRFDANFGSAGAPPAPRVAARTPTLAPTTSALVKPVQPAERAPQAGGAQSREQRQPQPRSNNHAADGEAAGGDFPHPPKNVIPRTIPARAP